MSSTPEADDIHEFNFDWDALSFTATPPAGEAWLAADEWEERVALDTTGYVSDPLTTSFTDLDLSEAQTTLRGIAELDSWPDA